MRSTDQLDAFNLQRFLQAQDPVFERVKTELGAGRKRSHWMWFIFRNSSAWAAAQCRNAMPFTRVRRPRPT